jgi:hypothetical protein
VLGSFGLPEAVFGDSTTLTVKEDSLTFTADATISAASGITLEATGTSTDITIQAPGTVYVGTGASLVQVGTDLKVNGAISSSTEGSDLAIYGAKGTSVNGGDLLLDGGSTTGTGNSGNVVIGSVSASEVQIQSAIKLSGDGTTISGTGNVSLDATGTMTLGATATALTLANDGADVTVTTSKVCQCL